MAITMMCDANEPGAFLSKYAGKDLWMKKEYEGKVVELIEKNGYDDSDFYAIAWDNGPVRIMYATTRGWSYPNHAEVDASPEVLAAYAAYREEVAAKRRAENEALKAAIAKNGDMVVVAVSKGKNKSYDGLEGEVFWVGENKFKRYGHTVGVKMADGNKIFVDADRARKPGAEESVEEAIRSWEARRKVMGYVH